MQSGSVSTVTRQVITNCLVLKNKEQNASVSQLKGVGLIKSESCVISECDKQEDVDICFKPFVFDTLVSLTGEPADQRSVRVLRDTGCSQLFWLQRFHFLKNQPAVMAQYYIEMGYVPRAVHIVHIQSKLVTGLFPVAVCSELPIQGIVY